MIIGSDIPFSDPSTPVCPDDLQFLGRVGFIEDLLLNAHFYNSIRPWLGGRRQNPAGDGLSLFTVAHLPPPFALVPLSTGARAGMVAVRRLGSSLPLCLPKTRLCPRVVLRYRMYAMMAPATTKLAKKSLFSPLDTFPDRHIGPNKSEVKTMLSKLGYESMDAFVADSVPQSIRISDAIINDEAIPALSESELFKRAKALANANKPFKSYIGMGYHNAVIPPVILRNVRVFTCLHTTTILRVF